MSRTTNAEIILEVDNAGFFLNHSLNIPFSQTNLAEQSFGFKKKVFWTARQSGYNSTTSTLELEVLKYNEAKNLSLYVQDFEFPIKQLYFKKLDWLQLEPLLYTYSTKDLSSVTYNRDTQGFNGSGANNALKNSLQSGFNRPVLNNAITTPVPSAFAEPKKTPPQPIAESVQIPFKDASFEDGCVMFEISIRFKNFKVRIFNPFIKHEFDYIKAWFSKRFQKETFEAHISAVFEDNQLNDVTVTSNEIAAINQDLIESCKKYAIEDFVRDENYKKEVRLYTAIDILKTKGTDKPLFDIDKVEPKEILDHIISLHTVRNKQQLEYLSSHELVTGIKLRITTHPEFGFIFPFFLPQRIYFIWELLNSHATYIWTFKASTLPEENMYQILEKQISIIEEVGRDTYISSEETKRNNAFTFQRVFHTKLEERNIENWAANIEYILRRQ